MKSIKIYRNKRSAFLVFCFMIIVSFISCFNVNAAEFGNYSDASGDIYQYYPNAVNCTECSGPLEVNASLDVVNITWFHNASGYVFNITFKDQVDVDNLALMLFFNVNGTYSSIDEIPPYSSIYNFFIQVNELIANRFTFITGEQDLVEPILTNGNKTIQMILETSNEGWIDSITGLESIDNWDIYGLSYINNSDGWQGYDYINWPWRFSNDQLRCPKSYTWVYVLVISIVIVVGGGTVFIMKKKARNKIMEENK